MSELNLKKNEVIKGWAKYYLTAEVNSGFERLTAPAFSYGMSAILAKLYKEDEEEYKKALQRHLMFYNSEATWGSVIFGMTCALEEERAIMLQEGAGSEELEASADMISNLKVGLMGPLAGIGDTIGWAMIPTIFGSIAASMGMEGNPLGIFLWAAFTFVFLVVRILQYEWGYGMGVNVITKFGKQITVFTEACSVLGLTVVGSLVATVVKLSTGLQFKNGDVVMKVQELIDGVMPALLPVAAVGIIYYFMKVKKVKMTWMILFIIVASMIGAATGIFTA